MSTYAEIVITFDRNYFPENVLDFSSTNIVGVKRFTWKSIRTAPGQVALGSLTGNTGGREAVNFINAFNLDLNFAGGYVVTRNVNVVTIKSNDPAEEFFDIYTASRIANTEGELVEVEFTMPFTITPYTGSPYFIENIGFVEATKDKCDTVRLRVETSNLSTSIIAPVEMENNTANPYLTNVSRGGVVIDFEAQDADGNTVYQSLVTPSFLDLSNRNPIVTPSPYGANLVLNIDTAADLEVQYSLDNVTYQNSDTFNSLVYGNYTVYVRDQYGCVKSFQITIENEYANTPYFYISKLNAIRFANRINFGTSANYKKDENTLSCENVVKDEKLAYKEQQLFQTSDIAKTQFKSNYSNHLVELLISDGTTQTVSVQKKTSNIGKKSSLDANIFTVNPTKTAIYFTAGNLYDYTTGTTTGTYELHGTLPEWAVIGNYVKYNNAFYLIVDKGFDEVRNAEYIVFDFAYSGQNNASLIVGCEYNLFNYEVYEFDVDFSNFAGKTLQVRITATDTNFQTLVYLSEQISVEVTQENTVDVYYWNDSNTDVFFQTGIKYRIRLPLFKKVMADEDDSENNKTDTDVNPISAQLYEGTEFTFDAMTIEMVRKAKQALSCFNLFIDEVPYTLNGGFEVEQWDDSNLYQLRVKLLKAGNGFNSDGTPFNYPVAIGEIPGLIETESGFVKY